MRNLGEQWIVEIDGVKHMVKAVKQRKEISNIEFKIHPCRKCLFQIDDCDCAYPSSGWKCDMEKGLIIKDLGPVNEDGCLAEERTGKFPTISFSCDEWCIEYNEDYISVACFGVTKQEAIDAWNRRTM